MEENIPAGEEMNVVMTGGGRFIEVQGTGEEATFSEKELTDLLRSAKIGIKRLTALQKKSLAANWPF